MRYSRPIIRFRCEPTEDVRPTAARMFVNDDRVNATFDPRTSEVAYVPTTPLPSGEHEISVGVILNDVRTIEKSWSFRVSPSALTRIPVGVAADAEFRSALNEIRRRHGLDEVEAEPTLGEAARSHAAYLAATGGVTHDQADSNHPLFSGRTPAERVAALGWVEGCWEGVGDAEGSMREATHRLFDAPYHRIPFLQPGSVRAGGAKVGARCAALFSPRDRAG